MRRREFLLGSLSVGVGLAMRPARAQPPASVRGAVVIGVDKAGGLPVLKAARSGARSVGDWLGREGFEVKLIVDDPNPVAAGDVKKAIGEFVRRGTLDQLVVYFAGHGCISGGLSEFWLLSGAPDDVDEAVSLAESRELARQSGIPNVVFISDACRSRASDLRAERIHGQVVFPNLTASSAATCDVDRFLATRIGDPAWEASLSESVTAYEGIYTACLLDAFKRPYPSIVETVDGKAVIPNRRLKLYLAQEVPKRAQAASIHLEQHPDAEVCSDEPTFIAHVSSPSRAQAASPAPTLVDVVTTEVFPSPAVSEPKFSPQSLHALAESSGLNKARESVAEAIGASGEAPLRCGFIVSGQPLRSIAVHPSVAAKWDGHSPSVDVDVKGERAASVALRFADGSGTVVAALDGYVGKVVIEGGRVTNVSYLPSRQSPMFGLSQAEGKRLEELHALVAAAARFGVFRIEGPKAERNRTASELADRIRVLKGVDPTLGLYAAYAYADAGLAERVRSVSDFMHGTLGIDLFDVAMLAGELAGRPPGPLRAYPFCPMLSQGWSLLRVKDAPLPESVAAMRDHLLPSLWTTLDAGGMETVESALRSGRVS